MAGTSKLDRLLTRLVKDRDITIGQAIAILGAVEYIAENKPDQWIECYGTWAMEGIGQLLDIEPPKESDG